MSRSLTIKPIIAWSVLSVVVAGCSSDGTNAEGVPASFIEDPAARGVPEGAPAPGLTPSSTPGATPIAPSPAVPGVASPPASPASAGAVAATAAAPAPPPLAPIGATGATGAAQDEAVAEPIAPPDDTSDVPVPVQVNINPFVSAAHDPLSTFAVDVDTASYDIFRRDVASGYLPSADTVRLEEFINYFDYDYPAPEAGAEQPFSIALAAAPSLFDTGTTLLRVGIQGELPPDFDKKATNLVFLVDVSGSMQSEEKLPLVQYVLTEALDVLDPEDTVSVVTYASGTQVVLPPTPVSEKDTIAGIINGLSAGGSTNGAGGIQLAYEQARDAYIDGGINHVVLCTDGDFNVGVSSTDGLIDLIEEERRSGVTFTALGFGAENNDAMMEAVSNAGNGMYGVIVNEDQATDYVHDRLIHNLTLIAKDVKIQVEFNPELVSAYRLLGYEDRAIADNDFRDDKVDAGEIGADHRVTALYELVLAGQEVPDMEGAPALEAGAAYDGETEVAAEDLVLVKVRYKDVDATEEDEAYEVNESLAPADVAEAASDLDEDFQWAMAVATFAEVLRGSPYASAELLPEVKELIEPQASRDADRMEFNTMFDSAVTMLESR